MPSRFRSEKHCFPVRTYYSAAELPTNMADARSGGFTIFLGKPCRDGHIGIRYTQNGQCKDCLTHSERQLTIALKVAPPEVVAVWEEASETAHPGNPYKARLAKRYLAKHWMRSNGEAIRAYMAEQGAADAGRRVAGPNDFDTWDY
jgi:hypothetical protein